MKLGYLLFGAATVTEVSGAKSPIKNIPKRLDNLKEWAEGCAEKLTPPGKGAHGTEMERERSGI